MAKKKSLEKPLSPSPESSKPAGNTLPDMALELSERAVEFFRRHHRDLLQELLHEDTEVSDWMSLMAAAALKSVIRMIEADGDCPLSRSEFVRIINESTFRGLVRPAEQSPESARSEMDSWQPQNERRLSLIRKGLTRSLTAEEQSELLLR
jgi:hypothetical protein